MTEARLTILIERYLSEELSAAERQELSTGLEEPVIAEQAKGLILEHLRAGEFNYERDNEILFARIEAAIDEETRIIRPIHRVHFLRRYRLAAACVFILAVATTWFVIDKQTGKPIQQTAGIIKNDVGPGTTRATLTLDDGTKIPLDAAKTGLLASEGKTSIVNANGELVYNAGDDGKLRFNIITTHKGEQFPLTLSDGTKIFVDASTTVRYPVVFTGDRREVEINGQVWFEVAKDANKPFYVVKGDKKVQVLGTHFNVMAYDNDADMKVTLVEGSVKVTNGKSANTIAPGQQAVLANQSEAIQVIKDADIEQATAWKNGQFAFHQADIATILKEIERWYDVDVEVRGVLPAKKFILEGSRRANLSELLRGFEVNNIPYRIDGEKKKLIVNP